MQASSRRATHLWQWPSASKCGESAGSPFGLAVPLLVRERVFVDEMFAVVEVWERVEARLGEGNHRVTLLGGEEVVDDIRFAVVALWLISGWVPLSGGNAPVAYDIDIARRGTRR